MSDRRTASAGSRLGPAAALLLLVALAVLAVARPLVGPVDGRAALDMAASDLPRAAAIAVFASTYLVLAIGRLPGSRLDRAGAALLGGSLMVAVGALTTEAAYEAIDDDTITLLLGMMILVGNLRLSGFFSLVNGWVAARARHPLVLLIGVVWSAGILSAFLVNDAICLVLAPLVLELVTRLRRDPRPYLLAVAMASNVGSVATITGNPQNMMIGSLSGIPYTTFLLSLAPVALLGLVVTTVMIAAFYRREFWGTGGIEGGWRLGELLDELPAGLDTVVGERGHRLSGGERQRLTIARLLLASPRVVILDEATAHLDSESEHAVQEALTEALVGRTSVVIAHRLSTVRSADTIAVVEHGRVVEQGTHTTLLERGGRYADLYHTQFAPSRTAA